MSGLSIQDSIRCELQRDLACTRMGEKSLVHISYVSMSSHLSPLFKKHATEIVVDFSDLSLNADVNTVMNLRPFMEVLLMKVPPTDSTSDSVITAESSPVTHRNDSLGSKGNCPMPPPPTSTDIYDIKASETAVIMKGMHILFTVSNVSLDLLIASSSDIEGVTLCNAFSLQITDLRADIDMMDLMKADVKLRSLDISDRRDVSRDYVFRKVICAVVDMDESLAVWRAAALEESKCYSTSANKTHNTKMKAAEKISGYLPDLLQLTYEQTSKDVSVVDILLLNMTAFVSMDAIMDLVTVSLANANAALALLAAPTPTPTLDSKKSVLLPPAPIINRTLPTASSKMITSDDSDQDILGTSMNVTVRIKNPQLIFLEDPTTDESRAIVGSCDIEVHYSNVSRVLKGSVNLKESIHVSVRDFDVSMLRSMLKRHAQPILEPMGMEYNQRKSFNNGVLVSSAMSIDLDNMTMRVSTKDITLAQSIMTRRLLMTSAAATAATVADTSNKRGGDVDVLITPPSSTQDVPSASHTVSFNMGCFSLVGINDFNGRNLPLIRFTLDGTTFHADGVDQVISGEGSLTINADFYNSRLSVWEPMIDKWRPILSHTSWALGSLIDVKSANTLQLTVSGAMLERLLKTYSLFFHSDDEAERQNVPDALVMNSLGPNISFDLYDSATNSKLMDLDNGEVKSISNFHSHLNLNKIFSLVDIVFTGEFGQQRESLVQLPFNINRPKICNLHYRTDDGFDTGEEHHRAGITKFRTTVLEPIVEEVYENSRYDPITAR